MRAAQGRRLAIAGVVSVAAHLSLFAYLITVAPTLPQRYASNDPLPERFVPVILVLRRAAAPAEDRPTPVRPRMARLTPQAASVPPLVIPPAPPGPPATTPATGLAPGLRSALRGRLGCSDLALDARERAACEERLGRGARDAAYIAPDIDDGIEAEGARKAALIKAREAPLRKGIQGAFVVPSDHSGEPHITGAGASAMGQATHPASRRAAQKLERMR